MRRAQIANATPPWFGELDELAMVEAADLCRLRHAATGLHWEADHMVPLRAKHASGLHCWSNIQVIPRSMNRGKRNRMKWTEPGAWLRDSQ